VLRDPEGEAGEGSRTPDLLFTRQVLYQLSYSGASSGGTAAKREDPPGNCNGAVGDGVFKAWIASPHGRSS
jgi:hypothetical protein